jgi:uncharacterized DUF497 family protein
LAARLKHQIETTYINEFMRDHAYGVGWTGKVDGDMARAKVDLADVNQVLRAGQVGRSDMTASGEGLWWVYGKTVDQLTLEVTVTVVAQEYRVTIIGVRKQSRRRGR